jgi:serine phosphatase RsbU (regulator of sigma subunit)/CHASE2 domain-containing sensor protein
MRDAVFDGYQRLFPLERTTAPAIVVAIDEEALARYGQWPWPRTRVAELIERVGAMHPAGIGLDIFFPEPDRLSPQNIAAELPLMPTELEHALALFPSNDERLADVVRKNHVVIGIVAGAGGDARFAKPPRAAPVVVASPHPLPLDEFTGHIGNVPVVDAAAAARGLLNRGPEERVVRTAPLVASVQGVIVPSLGVEALRVATDTGLKLVGLPDGLLEMRFAGTVTRLQDDGTAWLRYSPHDPDRFISAREVLDGRADPARIQNKVVLIGINGSGVLDFKTTALGEFVPGVEIHVQEIENVFNGVWLVRPRSAPWGEGAALALCALLVVFAIPRLGALKGLQLVVLMVILLAGAGLIAFRHFGVLLDPATPAVNLVAVYLSVVVGSLSEADRQRRLLREQAARMAGEVDAARRIQMGLLPDPREVEGEDGRVRVAAILEPARSVGGDFYDLFRLDERRLFFAVADVSGKGLPAALFMAAVKSQLKSAALRGGPVGEILARAQADMAHENPEHLFVTVLAGVLDLATGELEHANAGHEAAFARAPNGVPERFAASGGPPLCVIDDYVYPTGRRTLARGEWVCAVTDGVTEAMNTRREFFGAERLRATLTWLGDETDPTKLLAKVREDVQRFADGAEPSDDITLVALRWDGG